MGSKPLRITVNGAGMGCYMLPCYAEAVHR